MDERESVRFVIALILALSCSVPFAQSARPKIAVALDGTTVFVSLPSGFTQVLPTHPQLAKLSEQLTVPGNRLLAHFISEADMEAFIRREKSTFDRYFIVQTSRNAEVRTLSTADFGQMRSTLRTQQANLIKKLEPRLSEFYRQAEHDRTRESGKSTTIQIGDFVPLGIYHDSESSIAFGLLSRVRYQEGTNNDDRTVVNVASLVMLKGKVLFLYTYAKFMGPNDIEWAKQASLAWTRDVLALNR